MRKYIIILITSVCIALASCTNGKTSDKTTVTVSLPVQEYFVKAIADTLLDVNVMIPVTAGHSTYTPLPSQLRALSRSVAYLAIGSLDFEIAWKERLMNAVDKEKFTWRDLDLTVQTCYTSHIHGDEDHSTEIEEGDEDNHEEHLAKDPHYWTSPIQARKMFETLSEEIKRQCGRGQETIDQKIKAINDTLAYFDQKLRQCSAKAFMIYHPALTYLARDYGMTQLTIEQEGKSISPRKYAEQIEKAREMGVKVVFCQQGYDTERVRSAANDLGAKIVEIQPESSDYIGTMNTIIDALR